MYKKTSNEFNNLIEQNGGRTFKARLRCSSFSIETEIRKITYTAASNAEDGITIGSACSAYIEVTLEKTQDIIAGKRISFDLGLEVNGSIEYVPMGVFKANKPETDDYQIKFKAYDKMTDAEKNYVSDLQYPTNTVSVMNEISQKLGIEFNTDIDPITLNNPNTEEGSSNIVFAGYTYREAIGYIAGLYGKFAIFNREGKLEFRWYEDNGFEIPVSKCYLFTKAERDYTIDKIIGIDQNNEMYEVGAGYRGISFSNPFVTQNIVYNIYEDIGGFTYRGGETKFLGDCRIDVWDIVKGTDLFGNRYSIPAMEITHEIDGGLTTTIKSKVNESENIEDSFKGPTTKAIERTHTQLLLVNNLVASKASIDYIESNYIKTNEIDAIEANIENAVIANLQGEFATIDYLKNNYAEINFANVTEETVGTLLANVGLISSATIVDGHVTGVLGAVKIDAGSITLGTLDCGIIDVTNLKADSITVGQINGYQIAPGAIDMDNLAESVTGEIGEASTNAKSAFEKALEALSESEEATLTASSAKITADGKNSVFYQTTAPSGTHKTNDVWFDTDDSNKMYQWNGSAWIAKQFGTSAIANQSITNALIKDATIDNAKISNLDAGKLTTGILDGDRIGANTITANKLMIADLANYATVNENFPDSMLPATNAFGGTAISDGYIVKQTATNQYLMLCDHTPCNFKSGEQIYYEMTIKGTVSGNIYVYIWYYDDSKENITWKGYVHSIDTTEQVISGTITISNNGANAAYFIVGVSEGYTPRKQIYIRKARFIRKSSGELIVDGAITTEKLRANAVTANNIASSAITTDKLAANAVTADKLFVGNGGNLYATGYDTFENIPNKGEEIYYQKAGTATVSIDNTTAYYGNRCLKIDSSGTNSYVYLGSASTKYGCIPVVAGKTYIVSAWMKASTTATAQLYVIGHTAKNSTNSQLTSITSSIGTSWTRVFLRYTATSTYPYISIRVDNDTTGTTLWVDAIQIETGTTTQEPSAFSPAGSTVIDGGNIITGSITSNTIASSAITTDKLAANAVTADKINVTDLSAISANLGTVTAGIIKSANYAYNTSGMKLDLATGAWDSKYFKIDSFGNITSTSGTIAGFTITGSGLFKIPTEENPSRFYLDLEKDDPHMQIEKSEKETMYLSPYSFNMDNVSSSVAISYATQNGRYELSLTKEGNTTFVTPNDITTNEVKTKKITVNATNGLQALVVRANTDYVGSFVENEFDTFGIYASENGNTGLFNKTKIEWLIKEDTEGNVFIPHELTAESFASAKFIGAPRPIENATSDSTGYYLGTSSYKWRTVYAYNSTINTSDRNEKHDIDYHIIDNIDEIYDELKPCSYIMNGGERTHFGFIAQDCEEAVQKHGYTLDDLAFICKDHLYVEEFDKEAEETVKTLQYNEDSSPKYIYGLRYNEIVPLNTMQIQKIKKENKELKRKVFELEEQMKSMQNILNQLLEERK